MENLVRLDSAALGGARRRVARVQRVVPDIRGMRDQNYWTARNAAEELMRTVTLVSSGVLLWAIEKAKGVGSDKVVLGLTRMGIDSGRDLE